MPPLISIASCGKRSLEAVDVGVAQRRHLAVLLRAQAREPRLAGVHREAVAAGGGHRLDEARHVVEAVQLVDADAVLDGHRQRHRGPHGGHRLGHHRRLGHQAGAEAPLLHPVAGAADVEVHLVEATLPGDARALGQRRRVVAAELQRQRPLRGREAEQVVPVAVDHRPGGDHLGVEQRAAGDAAQEGPEVAVRAVHHRRHRQRRRHPAARTGGGLRRGSGCGGSGCGESLDSWHRAIDSASCNHRKAEALP